jgi:hypothetical protein
MSMTAQEAFKLSEGKATEQFEQILKHIEYQAKNHADCSVRWKEVFECNQHKLKELGYDVIPEHCMLSRKEKVYIICWFQTSQ